MTSIFGINLESADNIDDINKSLKSYLKIDRGTLNMNGNKISNLAEPENDGDVTTKKYVDYRIGKTLHSDLGFLTESDFVGVPNSVTGKVKAKVFTENLLALKKMKITYISIITHFSADNRLVNTPKTFRIVRYPWESGTLMINPVEFKHGSSTTEILNVEVDPGTPYNVELIFSSAAQAELLERASVKVWYEFE